MNSGVFIIAIAAWNLALLFHVQYLDPVWDIVCCKPRAAEMYQHSKDEEQNAMY